MALRAGSFVTKNRGGSSDSISGVNFEGGSVRTGKASRHAREACPTALERSRPSRRFQPRQEPSNGASRAPLQASRGRFDGSKCPARLCSHNRLALIRTIGSIVPTLGVSAFAQLAQLFPQTGFSPFAHPPRLFPHSESALPARPSIPFRAVL